MTVPLVLALPPVSIAGYSIPVAVLVGYGTVLGVAIDFDHFLIARLKTGTWDAVRFCLRNPTAAVAAQDRIFRPGDVGVLSRLLSHLLLAGLVVPLLAAVSVPLSILTGIVLYVHVVTDVVWDIHRLDHQAETAANEAELLRALR
ncbi:hypothetical protein [Halopiger goleimassiliensis]|uniref:hypothetical protein n=1 Tax=Halopiger goleimassiliensis TaxID=1293048 RepID=UPI000677AF12|nr:hypothetical protein [Halopiger goleimassiliensis]